MTKLVTFRKLESHEKIRLCDFHSLDEGKMILPIVNTESVGDTPSEFSPERSFWRVVGIQNVGNQ